ncbi:two-component regulator propeller domain-containing protein [Colwellia psychrerythraea]|uniref:histidine kinase n=1 Tax=Colwellia psychrerythraea TaxID=28229 RepID=A0A099KL24_COLPS|nr:two-component regulator propeller domain-containing protein [Colwellia psychrerythraea]KGJ90612.1 putative PAS/PAC sensor protein [Colwellia psychrerythraea]
MGIPYRFSLILLLFCSWQVSANIRFTAYDIEDGLSQNTINTIIQDKYGFMWFGSQDGLNRFDGFEFETFLRNKNDKNTLSNEYVNQLFIDLQGTLWIATRGGGLNRFNYETETFDHFVYDKAGNNDNYYDIKQIIQANPNELWLATHSAGIQVFNLHKQTFSTLPLKHTNSLFLSQRNITCLTLDTNNNLWLGSAVDGLFKYTVATQTIEIFSHNEQDSNSLSDNQITTIYQDKSNDIWVATLNGLNRYQAKSNDFQRYMHNEKDKNSLSHNVIRDIKEDPQQVLWLATSAGLNKLNKNRDSFYHYQNSPTVKDSLSGNVVYSLYPASDGIMWIGFFARGINKFYLTPRLFQHIYKDDNSPNSLQSNEIWGVFEDSKGEIWLATDGGGLNHYDKKSQKVKTYLHDKLNKNTISSNRVWAIAEEEPGVLWVATYDAGLNLIDTRTNKVEHFMHQSDNDNSLIDNQIVALYKDKEQNLWIGTKNGLDKFNIASQKFTHFSNNINDKSSLSFNFILSIFEDSRGLLWVSTYGGGLNSYDKKTQKFTRYQHDPDNDNSIINNVVMSASEDNEGNIWIATVNGLNKLDFSEQKFTLFNKQDGLANETIYSVLEGNDNALWFSSNRGISRLDPKDNAITNFSLADGLQSYEFNSGAFLKSSSGEIYFGGINGLNIFNPRYFNQQQQDLALTITKVRLFNQTITIKNIADRNQPQNHEFQLNKAIYLLDELTLSHKESLISFEFSTLDFSEANNINFEYKLDNWDKNWIKTSHKSRLATYTNIPPGSYTLMLRAKHQNQQWGSKVTRLPITVKPAPWLSWWAYSLYILTITVLTSLFFYHRYQAFLFIKENEERLTLSLWGSNSELWDWHISQNYIFRLNSITNNKNGKQQFNLENLKETTHPDDINEVISAFSHHRSNKSADLDITYRRQDTKEQWRWYRSRAKAVSRDEQGNADRIVGTIEDINQLVEAQNQLQDLNVELELRVQARTVELSDTLARLTTTQEQLVESEKMASLVNLVTGVAHELNTPLGVILTATSQLEHKQIQLSEKIAKKTLSSQLLIEHNKQSDACIRLINGNIKKSINLVDNFKALSYSSQNEARKTIALSLLFENIVKDCSIRTKTKAAFITIHCPKQLNIVSYPQMIKEVFNQLVENSCLHAFEDILANQVEIEITITDKTDEIHLLYQDNGEGLSDDLVGNIFDPFSTTKRGSDCIGLGMPIVYNQVMHSLLGTIKLTSPNNGGIEIIIILPKK